MDPIAGRMLLDGHRWLMSKENIRYADVRRSKCQAPDGGPVNVFAADDPAMQRELARNYALVFARGAEAVRQLELQASEFEELPALGS